MIDWAKTIRMILLDKGIKQYQFGELLGLAKQDTNKLLNRQDYRINADIARIADALGYDVRLQLIDRQTGDIIDVK